MLLLAKQKKKELAEGKLETPAAAQFLKYHIIGKLIWLYTFFTHGKETVMQSVSSFTSANCSVCENGNLCMSLVAALELSIPLGHH